MGKLILVRHGKTDFNQQKLFTGLLDIDINDAGKIDALKVASILREQNIVIDAVFTSWLKRAWQTLDIILAELDQQAVPITKHPFLNERHYGELQGHSHSEIAQKLTPDHVQVWRRSYAARPPNGESLADVVYRATYYFEQSIQPLLTEGKTVMVCAHGNSNRALVKYLENISDEEIIDREIAYDKPLIYERS